MIEPPKLAVFLFVVTAHLAVLAFGFPNMSPTPESSGRHQSASADMAVVEKSSQPSGSVTDAEKPKFGAGADHDHGDHDRPSATRASANSSATHAGRQPDSDEPVDTVPTLEEHRRQHGHDDHQHDHDSEPELVDLERVAHNDSPPKTTESPTADAGIDAGNQKPAPTQLAVAPKSSTGLKPLPVTADQIKTDVPARPTPVQMITAEKPEAKPSVTKPKLKPVAKPTTSTAATEPPRARPVANAPKPVAPTTSNRAGSARMKNLRPIKKP